MNKNISHTQSSGKLVICPTPIGNLGDVTQRMLNALEDADVVFAEDTRVTGKLLAALGVKKPLERLDEATMSNRAQLVLDRVTEGQNVAYCSDAGMPGVSDPGLRLVALAREAGLTVEVLPGPVAAVTAYVASGCVNQHFFFGGFLPRKESQRAQTLNSLAGLDAALLFYESPNRLVDSLKTIAAVFPQREIAVCRELTKLHEEVFRSNSETVYQEFLEREKTGGIKGEIVVVIDGASELETALNEEQSIEHAKARACELKQSGLKNKEICKQLVAEFGIARNVAYDLAIEA